MPQPQLAPASLCKPGTFAKTELYFGLSRVGGEIVSEAEWQEFLNRVVTPSFREGLTVIDGRGQYLNQRGVLVKEPSKLLILVYLSSAEKEREIADLISAYKKAFAQESVLCIISCVHVEF